jgi:hypothetical protein
MHRCPSKEKHRDAKHHGAFSTDKLISLLFVGVIFKERHDIDFAIDSVNIFARFFFILKLIQADIAFFFIHRLDDRLIWRQDIRMDIRGLSALV